MSDTRIDFRYTPRVVAYAQRTRFFHSSQLKVILLFWVGSTLFIAAPLLLPGVFPQAVYTNWGLVIQVSLAYAVTLGVLLLVTPWADFYLNRFWRLPLVLRYNPNQLRISVSGKQGGLRLAWQDIIRAEENAQVYILYYGAGNKFIILPKYIFNKPADERRFRDLLARRALLPAAPAAKPEGSVPEEPAEVEEAEISEEEPDTTEA